MTQENLAVLSDNELAESGQNSQYLKEQALSLIQTVCGEAWSDHNTGDPGITLLEVLAFVISDLSYRLDFPIRDLLAVEPESDGNQAPFYLAPQILPSNAVTLGDHRRAIIDIAGIKNASVVPASGPGSSDIPVAGGSVDIYLDLEDHWQDKTAEEKLALYQQVRHRFLAERNINQDINAIIPIAKHDVVTALSLAFENISSPVASVIEVFAKAKQVLTPGVKRYSSDMLKAAGYTGDEIFDGPLLSNGFVRDLDIERLQVPETIYASDVFESLDEIGSLKRIKSFAFMPVDGDDLNQGEEYLNWRLKILDGHIPRYDINSSLELLELTIDGQPYVLSTQEKETITDYFQQSGSQDSDAVSSSDVFAEYIGGRYRDLKQYISLQHEFPAIYKLAQSRLDGDIDSQEQANIMQLKGYLTLFDQCLADQCAQLENLRKLLALPDQAVFPRLAGVFDSMLASESLLSAQISQFWQDVRQLPLTRLSQPVTDISGAGHLLGQYFDQYQQQGFQSLAEPILSYSQLDRLKRSLEHLLGRFAETSLDANVLKYGPVFSHYLPQFEPLPADISDDQVLLDKLVMLKQVIDLAKIINHYPRLSKYRTGGFNYLDNNIEQSHVSGLSARIMTFMGFSHIGQIPLATNNRESFYLLEGELLRHGDSQGLLARDALFFVLPEWPTRLAEPYFNQLLDTQITRGCPVHLTPNIIRLKRPVMSLFEGIYYAWLNVMSKQPLLVTEPTLDGKLSPQSTEIQDDETQSSESQENPEQQELLKRLSAYLRGFTYEPELFPLFMLKQVQMDISDLSPQDLAAWLLEHSNEGMADEPLISLSAEVELSLSGQDQLNASHNSFEDLVKDLTSILSTSTESYGGISVNDYLFICLIRLNLKIWLATEHRDGINALDLVSLGSQVSELFLQQGSSYPDLTSDDLLTVLCHQHLERLLAPKNISSAKIGQTFRVGYQKLEQLKTHYPISIAKINPNSNLKPELTLAINEPFNI